MADDLTLAAGRDYGDTLWTPTAESAGRTEIVRYARWLAAHGGPVVGTDDGGILAYRELWQWSVDELGGRSPVNAIPFGPGSTRWSPTVVTPAALDSQAKRRSGSSAVTRQRDEGSRGWLTIASLPTPIGPWSRRRTDRMLRVSSGQRSTSVNNRYTCAGDAPAVAVTRYSIQASVPCGT